MGFVLRIPSVLFYLNYLGKCIHVLVCKMVQTVALTDPGGDVNKVPDESLSGAQ